MSEQSTPAPGSTPEPGPLPALGATAGFRKTVTEADVVLFAGITGDFAPQHVDADYMSRHPLGERVAHGILTLGIASTAASALCAQEQLVAVSAGYDRLRFLRPVVLGDTVDCRYEVVAVDEGRRRASARVEVRNQRGEMCLAATHLLHCY
ncbi:MaoC family dehydratase [Georgenia muralis]|uniref:Acyl dehydratase n=1 Tax=Georgenia muralis TaxID=154117 RepID=A0A3N4ZKT8_9MICO|nr:MaoC/PaaZ C-terminal domain-containing protein [Georgenia muralis]RPF26272.1 acyl dehydratase [Georgenia muralis]